MAELLDGVWYCRLALTKHLNTPKGALWSANAKIRCAERSLLYQLWSYHNVLLCATLGSCGCSGCRCGCGGDGGMRGAESSSSIGGVHCWFGGLPKPIAEVGGV